MTIFPLCLPLFKKPLAALFMSLLMVNTAFGADQPPAESSGDVDSVADDEILQAFTAKYRNLDQATNPELSNYFYAFTHVKSADLDVPETLVRGDNFASVAINAKKIPVVEVNNANAAQAKITLITDQDSQNRAYDLSNNGNKNILVMNAANAICAGGSWTKNSGTQEESLYFTTDLFNRVAPLTNRKEPAYS